MTHARRDSRLQRTAVGYGNSHRMLPSIFLGSLVAYGKMAASSYFG